MDFGTLAVICAVALLGPVLSLPRWLHLPVVIGELVVGVVLGATGLQVLHAENATFAFLAEIGFALVMFVAGSHVPIRDRALRADFTVGAGRAVAIGVLAVGVGVLVARVFGTGHSALYAVLLASSSAGLVLPIIAGNGLSGPAVVALLPQIAMADAACIVALPLAVDPPHALRALLGSVVVLAAAGVVFLALRHLEASGRRRAVHHLSEERGLAIELRLSLTLLFGLAALAVLTHVSVMLAGFSLGLAVAGVGEPRRLTKQLFALTEGFFAPVFFVWLGASLNLRDLVTHPSSIALGLVLGVGAVLVHGLLSLSHQPVALAVMSAGQLGVPVAAATLGAQLGLLGPGEPAALLLGALVTIAAVAVASGRAVATPAPQPSSG
ncbi:MAG TPA: cation:proton antiporter [Candidatus Lustribacter sp.]|nr:cation:proton antiporter [Candidatus Lustribacter sp.]